ncbi:MAG: orotidine-5'-phosphate decarboxylase [Deltaproteobacteria bacterium]|nr:orotidine-5'-phosphate decarboxylase [Deltaproteobacteria bacterium]
MSVAAARRRLVLPLDVDSVRAADRLVRLLGGEVGIFKIGKQLFMHTGPEVVRRVQRRGGEVFLDLKFHDIPRTVALAGVEAARLGVRIFDVHASGGAEMMATTAAAVRDVCRRERLRRPLLLAVTVLTSLVDADLRRVGVASTAARQVVRLARLAQANGMDGVVASPREIAAIRRACGPSFVILTPGIRQAGDALGDQKRVETPEAAMRAGADYLVVGRPIRDAADPVAVARAIVGAMARGLAAR